MRTPIVAAITGMAIMLGAGPALAWDLHDTLAPGPTPQTADAPPRSEGSPSGADLRLTDVEVVIPNLSPSVGPPLSTSRCREAITLHGERSAEAWTQC